MGLRDVQRPTGGEGADDRVAQRRNGFDVREGTRRATRGRTGPLPGQIQDALDQAQAALDDAGLARSDAATAISDAQQALTDAATAIADAFAAANAAADAQTTADGKNSVVRSSSAATGAGSYQAGDQWWQFDGADIVGLWLHDGSDWQQQELTSAIIASLDAGKITTGILAAARIGAESITAAKLAADSVTTAKIAALAVTAAESPRTR